MTMKYILCLNVSCLV